MCARVRVCVCMGRVCVCVDTSVHLCVRKLASGLGDCINVCMCVRVRKGGREKRQRESGRERMRTRKRGKERKREKGDGVREGITWIN